MIAISALTFDPSGVVRFKPLPASELSEVARRVNRVPTLDGGASVTDRGYSDADRTFRVEVPRNQALHTAITRMLRLYPRVRVATNDGCFIAAPQNFNARTSLLTLLVIERTSE